MVFQFEQMVLDQQPGKDKWDLAQLPFVKMKQSYARWQQGLHGCGWNSLFLNDHDLPRIVSRWGVDGEYRVQSAKLLATMLHGMQGTPYIYQGEELGMTNVRLPLEQYQDVEIHNMYKKRLAEGYPEEEILRSIYAKGRISPYPHAVERRSERRFHHRYPLAAGEPELHDHQCRGCSGGPGLGVLAL